MKKEQLEKMVKYLAVSMADEYKRHYSKDGQYSPQQIIDRVVGIVLYDSVHNLWVHHKDADEKIKELTIR